MKHQAKKKAKYGKFSSYLETRESKSISNQVRKLIDSGNFQKGLVCQNNKRCRNDAKMFDIHSVNG